MQTHRPLPLFVVILFLVLVACDVVMGTPVIPSTGVPPIDPQVQIEQAVAATLAMQTQIALSVQQTLAGMVPVALDPTLTPALTQSPDFTQTASQTSTLIPSFTPAGVWVRVSLETNCRTGPGTVYDKLGLVRPGETAEAIGRSASSDNWIVRLPSNPAITCWLWAQWTSVTGDSSSLPIITPPPSPTPTRTSTPN